MAIDINDLPEFSDNIKEPFYTAKQYAISKLIMTGNGLVNPLKSKLNQSVGSLIRTGTTLDNELSPSGIDSVISGLPSTDSVFTSDHKTKIIDSLNDLKTNLGGIDIDSIKDKASSFLEHTEELSLSAIPLSSSANEIMSLPKKLISDIEGGLPSDFPGIPDFENGVPTFSGFSGMDPLGYLGITDKLPNIPGLKSISNLTGVNLPGIPDSNEVINSIASSITSSEFGGIGNEVNDAFRKMTGGLEVGTEKIKNLVGSLSGASASTLANFAETKIDTLKGISDEIKTLKPKLNEMSQGIDDMITGERTALYGCSCASTQGGGATICNSANSALGKATTIERLAKNKTSAKIVKSLASDALKDILEF